MLRSILSVATGILFWGLLWVGAGMGLASASPDRFDAAGLTTDPAMLVALLVISMLLSVAAGWICAAIAPRVKMKHVTILAILQLAIGIAIQAGVWTQMPIWYHLPFLALVVPMHLLGGRIRVGKA